MPPINLHTNRLRYGLLGWLLSHARLATFGREGQTAGPAGLATEAAAARHRALYA